METQLLIPFRQETLAAALHLPEEESGRPGSDADLPLVVICHGFIGSRLGVDRLFVKAARAFAKRGIATLRFDYAGCGESTGEYGETGLDSLIEQTRAVLDTAGSLAAGASRIILLGHSLGGAVAVQTAVQDRRVDDLVLWASVGHPFRDIVGIVGQDAYEQAVREGVCQHAGYRFRPDFFASLARHQPFESARRFGGDVFIVHGTGDDVVPVDYAFLYQKVFALRGQGNCEKEIVFSADHTFSSFEANEELLAKTTDWLVRRERRSQDWLGWGI
ncbi:alpha/beta hydrolase [Paenibacillus sp. J31TS4]|uniref:alpha/beta hydrolase n=1 Tax=Paenibacillus sp. J31TS4 TaxID=2807195 RepID=UPI001B1A68DF|nr:alpha/beta fold hydrolase [Paenibacillus sp. J31TS4]GIP39160.1 alpha/beta hydrolase [Paenibacillus sp. J31TS4]